VLKYSSIDPLSTLVFPHRPLEPFQMAPNHFDFYFAALPRNHQIALTIFRTSIQVIPQFSGSISHHLDPLKF
jgi:hypothetical protein